MSLSKLKYYKLCNKRDKRYVYIKLYSTQCTESAYTREKVRPCLILVLNSFRVLKPGTDIKGNISFMYI